MAEEVLADVQPESSPGSETQPDPSSQATTPPAQPPAEPQVPFHQHPRFQQLIRDGQMSRQTIATLQQQLQEASQKYESLAKKVNQGTQSPEEAEQFRQAGTALERILLANPEALERVLMSHPKFAALLQHSDRLLQMTGGVEQMQQTQRQSLARQGVSHIHGLAKEAGLPGDPKYLASLVNLVEATALQTPDARSRFAQGDLSVLDEAFTEVQQSFLTHMQRAGTAQLLETKARTAGLPPRSTGGAPGPPGLPKYDPTKPNALGRHMNDLAKIAGDMLAAGDGQREG